MKHAVITLVERDFLYGAAALFNSLKAFGFNEHFFIGYKSFDKMPPGLLEEMRQKSEELNIHWVHLDTDWHFTNYKAAFLSRILNEYPMLEKATYLDPDIVCTAPWDWIAGWCNHGPAVCADVNWNMPPDHPTRHVWMEYAARIGLNCHHKPSCYFNGGFFSVRREDAEFPKLWHRLTETFGSIDNPLDGKGDIIVWRKGGRWMPFNTPDQDALNMAFMLWEKPISTLGPEIMGFFGNGYALLHALGAKKPWKKRYLASALGGSPPSAVDKAFWSAIASGPLLPFSKWKIRRTHATIQVLSLLGRAYRRR